MRQIDTRIAAGVHPLPILRAPIDGNGTRSRRGDEGAAADGVWRRGLPSPDVAAEHPYFPVATHKFIVLSICTLTIYELYWSYRQWQRIQRATGEPMRPFWRAFFAPLWGFSLFDRIRDDAVERNIPAAWNAPLLAILYLLLSLAWRLPDPVWLISLASFLPMIPVVRTVARINAASPAAEGTNGTYSAANIVTILVGAILLLLAILGTFIEDPAA